MPIHAEQEEQLSVVRLEGALDITVAAELKQALAEAVGRGAPIRLSVSDLSGLDVTAVQLLWAAGRAARAAGVEFKLEGVLPELVAAKLAAAGFTEILPS